MNAINDSASIAHMNPTMVCGMLTNAPLIGIQINVASDAMKYKVPKYLPNCSASHNCPMQAGTNALDRVS